MSQDFFNIALGSYGQPWRFRDEKSIEAQALQLLFESFHAAIKNQRKAIGPKGIIYCDLIDNPTFNALATTYKGHEFVTLFSGAINRIYSFYFGLLSDPKSLSSIGDVSRESFRQEALDQIRSGRIISVESILPKDAQRTQVARDLSLFTCLFMLLHEVGHIVRVHPTYLHRKYGLAVYEELPASSISIKQSKIRLAFEWVADEYAAITSYQIIHQLLENTAHFPGFQSLDKDFIWSISVSMTFAMMGHFSGGMYRKSTDHPPPTYRYIGSMLAVEDAKECKKYSPQGHSLQNGFREVVKWFNRNNLKLKTEDQTRSDHSTTSHEEGYKQEYKEVKTVLMKELDFLNNLEEERRIGAEAWRKSNEIE